MTEQRAGRQERRRRWSASDVQEALVISGEDLARHFQIFDSIRLIARDEGVTIFLVEQNAFHALKLAHRGYVMINGRITLSGTGRELLANQEVRAAYLEGGHA